CQLSEYPKSNKAQFGRDLRAACPSVRKARPRDHSKRYYVYAGITRRSPDDLASPDNLAMSNERIQELVNWYKDEAYRRLKENTLDALNIEQLDQKLFAILRQEASPELLETEFKRIIDLVFAV